MVAIKNAEAERFIAKPPAQTFLYLVFGTDPGLISERAHKIAAKAVDDPKDSFQLLRFNGDDIAADPLRLADEANAVPMFGGRKAIWIEAQGKSLVPALEPVIQAPPEDCVIVIESGSLKRDAPLRKLCEGTKLAAAIECYPDSAKDIAQLIDAQCAEAGLTIAADAKSLLGSLLGQDRLTTRAELDKLMLFAHGDGRIELSHVETIVADASSLALDDAVDGAFLGRFADVEETAARAFSEGADPNLLLGAALRHALTLHRTRLAMEAGQGPSGGFGGGWRRSGASEEQARDWSSARLAKAVTIIADAIGKIRREPKLAEIAAVRALWSVALMARSKGR